MLLRRSVSVRAVFHCNKKWQHTDDIISSGPDWEGGVWTMVHDKVHCVATDQPRKPQGTSRLSWIIKNASPGEDRVAPKQANKNTTALIME